MNTAIEAVDDLVIQTKGFKSSIVKLTKARAPVKKEGGIVGNKVDNIYNEINEMMKRLAKVVKHTYTSEACQVKKMVSSENFVSHKEKSLTTGIPEGVLWKDVRIIRKIESGIVGYKGKISVALLFQTSPIWLLSLEPNMARNIYLVGIKPLSGLSQQLTTN